MKLVSLNIYGNRFIDQQLAFFQQEQPDVLCLQEVYEVDLPVFEQALGMKGFFVPLTVISAENPYGDVPRGAWGIAILSKYPLLHSQHSYYQLNGPQESLFPHRGPPDQCARALLWADINVDSRIYTVATTHFTWARNEQPTQVQLVALEKLLTLLQAIPEVVLCGDFNAPRGHAIFDQLASQYTDNIPVEITTTIDQNLHRVKGLTLVVDGLFTTPAYVAEGVRVIDGVSDHCGIVADVKKAK